MYYLSKRFGTIFVVFALLWVPAFSRAQAVPSLYQEGRKAFKEKKYKLAVLKLKAFLNAYPKHILVKNALYLLGEAYYQLGEYERAIAVLQKAVKDYPLFPEAPRAILLLARSYAQLGDISYADKILNNAIQGYPRSRYINIFWYERGKIAFKLREYDKAVYCFKKALKNCKDRKLYMEICFALGDAYMALQNLVAARDFYQEVLKKGVSPYTYLRKHPRTYFNLAEVFFAYEEYEKALKAYEETASLLKEASLKRRALVKAGDTALKLKQYKKALTFYCQVIQKYPTSDEAWISKFRMADIGAEQPNLKIPIASCYEAYRHPWDTYVKLSKSPLRELAELAHFRMAQFKLKYHEYKAGIELLKKHLSLFPGGKLKEPCLLLLRESLLEWLNELYTSQRYLAFLKVFLDNKSYFTPAEMKKITPKIADAYYKEGLYEEALDYYQRLPLTEEIILRLGQIYFDLNYYPDAEHLLEPFLKETMNLKLKCEGTKILAAVYYQEQKYGKALPYYLYFLNTCQKDSSLYFPLAQCYFYTGELDKAIYFLQMLLDKTKKANLKKKAYLLLAKCFFKKEDYKKALNHYHIALDMSRDEEEKNFILYQMCLCYQQMGKNKKAVSLYDLLEKSSDNLWHSLAAFNKEDIQWKEKNKKFIQVFNKEVKK